MTDTDRIRKRISTVERKLLREPKKLGSVERSIAHAELQIQYWKLRQMLASKMADDNRGDWQRYDVESRKCTEMCAEWERRKSDAHNKIILRKLEDIERRINAKQKQQDRIQKIETD